MVYMIAATGANPPLVMASLDNAVQQCARPWLRVHEGLWLVSVGNIQASDLRQYFQGQAPGAVFIVATMAGAWGTTDGTPAVVTGWLRTATNEGRF